MGRPYLRCALAVCVTALPLLSASSGIAEDDPAPLSCDAAAYRAFDFWLGSWEVKSADGKLLGTNRITRILDGCALEERWTGARGGRGTSHNTWDANRRVWHQTWVDDRGNLLLLEGGVREGKMVLEGDSPGKDGRTVRNRITWEPLDDGRVLQTWEVSTDGGNHWKTVFHGIYHPAS